MIIFERAGFGSGQLDQGNPTGTAVTEGLSTLTTQGADLERSAMSTKGAQECRVDLNSEAISCRNPQSNAECATICGRHAQHQEGKSGREQQERIRFR